jgi:hypothetical protein
MRASAALAQRGSNLLDVAGRSRGDHHLSSRFGQGTRDRSTDSASRPGHDGAAPVERARGHAALPGVSAPSTASARTAPRVSTLNRPSSTVASAGQPK